MIIRLSLAKAKLGNKANLSPAELKLGLSLAIPSFIFLDAFLQERADDVTAHVTKYILYLITSLVIMWI